MRSLRASMAAMMPDLYDMVGIVGSNFDGAASLFVVVLALV